MNKRNLKKLLLLRKEGMTILGSVNENFIFKASEIMKIYLELCEGLDDEGIYKILLKSYALEEVNSFFDRLELVKGKLFIPEEIEKKADNSLFNKRFSILTLNICRNCNMKCDYCFEGIAFRRMSGIMEISTAIHAVNLFLEQCEENIIPSIIFTGGEPLVNFRLISSVVNYLKLKAIRINFTIKTNATLIDKRKMNFLINNNFRISISLDGCEYAHDYHRKLLNGKGTFRKVENIINSFIERKYGSNISLSGTITHQTIDYIDESLKALNSFKGISFYDLKPVMSNDTNIELSFNDYKTLAEKTSNNNLNIIKISKPCGIGLWHIAIDVDGLIYPCYRLCGINDYLMGNIFNTNLSSIKAPEDLIRLYNLEQINGCRGCHLTQLCQKGCFTDKLLKMKDNECFGNSYNFIQSVANDYYIIKGNHEILPMI